MASGHGAHWPNVQMFAGKVYLYVSEEMREPEK